ncbi:male sterility protein-domain-containing protein [Hysterangium stoloniferum]|nr:male sterility protein-domain-containing protein [Hysterangium stoloniferum]
MKRWHKHLPPCLAGRWATCLKPTVACTELHLTPPAHDRIRTLISKYSEDLRPHKSGSHTVDGKIIALSGSTGSAGSSILFQLLGRADVKRIYLLLRQGKETLKDRQIRSFRARGLDTAKLDSTDTQIVYLEVDFSQSGLGLPRPVYCDLRDSITHIIHAAWHVSFNLGLDSFERVHIAGVRHLIELALSSPQEKPPRLVFLSSIGAVVHYKGPSQPQTIGDHLEQVLVPESPLDDPSIILEHGYSQSKYISERIICNAVHVGLRATISRVGQLSGHTVSGAWAKNEYIPIMLRSILALGLAPNDSPPARWIPCDVGASALIKQAFCDKTNLHYFSVENPFLTPWNVVIEALSVTSPKPLRLVPFATWLDYIKGTKLDPQEVPAVRLIDFFSARTTPTSRAALGWDDSVKITPELAMGPISVELMKRYILYQQQLRQTGVV